MDDERLPLRAVRVLELTDALGGMCGRMLADLGADVLLVELPGGAAARRSQPVVDGTSLPFLVQTANKRRVEIDWSTPAGRDEVLELASDADILLESHAPGALARAGLDAATLRARNGRLVITSVTDFGQTGPYRDWAGTDWVHLALSSVLSRSGNPDRPPLMPPGRLAAEHGAAQAAWATLVAHWNTLRTGVGEDVDVSLFEALVQSMDAAYGMGGTATGGVPAKEFTQGRPDVRHLYPIFPCRDGHVRICLLGKRQWRAMRAWLGEPADFIADEYDTNVARFRDRDRLYPLITALFAPRAKDDLVDEGQARGVPIEAVRTAAEVLHDEHLAARGSFVDIRLPSGRAGRLPQGFLELDGGRVGYRRPLTDGAARFLAERRQPGAATPQAPGRPLAGLRVLDLGIIVVGGETGRLFADLGADVIKVESRAFPDGSRAASPPGRVSATFAWGHRNKRSVGIDLRHPEGRALFLRLVAVSDVVLSNFKPGTMDSLGLGFAELSSANPAIVSVDSSALGRTGPASRRMGYGPLVRARSGLTSLWRYPDDPAGFSDAITIYPDHTAARYGAAAALAAVIDARRTGRGRMVSIAQVEVMLTQFAAEFLRESIEPRSLVAVGNSGEFDAPQGVYPCRGEDDWCVVTVRDTADWCRLQAVLGADVPALDTPADRIAHRAELDKLLTEWTAERTSHDVMSTLQAAGVPAAAMLRVVDLPDDPHLVARDFFSTMRHPQLEDLPAESGPAIFRHISRVESRPAPLHGQQTREICREILGLPDDAIGILLDGGVLEESPAPQPVGPTTQGA